MIVYRVISNNNYNMFMVYFASYTLKTLGRLSKHTPANAPTQFLLRTRPRGGNFGDGCGELSASTTEPSLPYSFSYLRIRL